MCTLGAGAQLIESPREATVVDNLPGGLQAALKQPAELKAGDGSIEEILRLRESKCFLLNLHFPDPALTNVIVWRLQDADSTLNS